MGPAAIQVGGPHSIQNNYFGGARRYVIDEYPTAPSQLDDAWLKWLMEQPSRLLDVRSQVVPFVGRDRELRQLADWRDEGTARLSVLLLHAAGGQGKTRLASEFAQQSRSKDLPEAQRWQVLQVGFDPVSTGSAPTDSDPVHGDGAGVLLIVDYADRWAHSELGRLLSDPVLHQPRPTRVLLLGRTVRWYAALRSDVTDLRAGADDMLLPPLTADRQTMFAAARDRFSAPDLYALTDPGAVTAPGSLDDPDFGLTLNVHMAALVAVEAYRRGVAPPSEPHELSAYLLDREYRAWQRLSEAGVQGQDFRTRPAIMARMVFAATLTGTVDHETGTCTVQQLNLPGHPDELLLDHRFCYPPTDRRRWLEPLYPDRLAEDFLALLTPGHDVSSYDPDPWAMGVADLLLSSAGTAACAPRALTRLAAAADRWQHVGTAVLYPLVTDKPQCAVDAGSPALAAIAAIGSAEDRLSPDLLRVLESVEPLLPEGSHVDLDVGTLEVTERLTAHRLRSTSSPARRAWMYGVLGKRRANAGHWAQALEADGHSVRIFQELADDDPRWRPHLAMAVNNLAVALSRNGRSREALSQARKAVALNRQTAQADPGERGSLALSLVNLGGQLADRGMIDQALTAMEEGVAIRRELASADPAHHLPNLVGDLNNLGNLLGERDRWEENETIAREAVDVSRRLVEAGEAEHIHRLAGTLTGLGRALLALERDAEAVPVDAEAADLYRRMAVANPGVYRHHLVLALINLSTTLARLDLGQEALELAEEAVEHARQAAESEPTIHRDGLVTSLDAFGDRLDRLGRKDDALAAFAEAVAVFEQGPGDHDQAHMRRMHRLADLYAERGDRLSEARFLLNLSTGMTRPHAISAARRAAEIYREEGAARDEAGALQNLSLLLPSEDLPDAIAATERAVTLYRQVGDQELEAAALNNLSTLLHRSGRAAEALTAAEQALIAGGQAGIEPEGQPLFNLARAMMEVGRVDEAITILRQAAAAYRDKDKGEYEESGHPWAEADTLYFLGDALTRAQRFDEAGDTLRLAAEGFESVGGTQRAREAQIARFAPLLSAARYEDVIGLGEQIIAASRTTADRGSEAKALGYVAVARLNVGAPAEALEPCEEAIAIFRELDDPEQARHEAAALTNLALIQRDLGEEEKSWVAHEKAASKWRETGSLAEEHSVLDDLGGSLFVQHRYEAAARAYQRDAEICRRLCNEHAEAKALFGLAASLVETNRFEEASAAAGQAAAMYGKLGDQDGGDLAMGRLQTALIGLERSPAALTEAADRAAEAFRQHGDRDGEGTALSIACVAQLGAQRWEEGISLAQRSVVAFHECSKQADEGEALIHLGLALFMTRRTEEAIDAYQRALECFSAGARDESQARALYGLGEALAGVNRFEEAVTADRRCTELLRALGNFTLEGLTLLNLCDALEHLDRFTEMISPARRAITIHTETREAVNEGKALTYLGRALVETGRTAESVPLLQRAAAIFMNAGDAANEARASFELGVALQDGSIIEAPIAPLRRAAECYKAADMPLQSGIASLNLASVLLGTRRLDEVIEASQQAATIFGEQHDLDREQQALGRLSAALMRTGRYPEAIRTLRKTIAICQRIDAPEDEAAAQLMLGAILTDNGHLETGAAASHRAAEIFIEFGHRELAGVALQNLKRARDQLGLR